MEGAQHSKLTASLVVFITALSACSSDPEGSPSSPDANNDVLFPIDVSGDAEAGGPDADATSALDTVASDADASPPPDADSGSCACTAAGGVGSTSLPCVCRQIACPIYDLASTACPPAIPSTQNGLLFKDYTDCGMVAIERHWGQDVSTYVYDATTHALIGEEYLIDTDSFTCGSTRVGKLHGGTFPTCAARSTTSLCPNEAGSDVATDGDGAALDVASDTGAPDGDASSCMCVPPDASSGQPEPGLTSLSCYCGSFACPAFDTAAANCPPGVGDSDYNTLVYRTYASCGLVAIERNFGLDQSIYVYDATTHDLVGAQYQTDVTAYTCGADRVAAVRAGTFPGASCSATTTKLCTNDAGFDAGAE